MAVVKKEDVEASIASIEFAKHGKKTTVGFCTLVNGWELVESSSCINEQHYNEGIGRELVRERLHHKIWELLGSKAQDVNAEKAPEQEPLPITDDEDAFEQPTA